MAQTKKARSKLSPKKNRKRTLIYRAKERERRRHANVVLSAKVWQPDDKPQVSANLDRMLERLGKARLSELIDQWRNAITTLADEKKSHLHPGAEKLLAAIDEEWQRRRHAGRSDDWFPFPDTHARLGPGKIGDISWLNEGILSAVGYHVGYTNGVRASVRQLILARLFEGELPPVFPSHYLDEWGEPESARRLQKMSVSIASFARNAKGDTVHDKRRAVADWEGDLKFLYDVYYDGYFGFAWPAVK